MRAWLSCCLLVGISVPVFGPQQDSLPDNPTPQPGAASSNPSASQPNQAGPSDSKAKDAESDPSKPTPNLAPPRSDRVRIEDLGGDIGESSSKDTQVDLTPPADDAKKHPNSPSAVADAEAQVNGVAEFHPWDPHKAAKDVEIGDFYFKRKNYHAAEDRYREALLYKDNDAIATFRLAECLEKLGEPGPARDSYQNYLKILPHGALADAAQKALERLKEHDTGPTAAKP